MAIQTEQDIFSRVRALIESRVDVAANSITPQSNLKDIGVDSFALIELVFQAEEEFGVSIPAEGLRVTTVDDVVTVIRERISSGPAV